MPKKKNLKTSYDKELRAILRAFKLSWGASGSIQEIQAAIKSTNELVKRATIEKYQKDHS